MTKQLILVSHGHFCEELKKYKDTVDCGEGMAKLLLWTYWEDLYDYWKIRSGGLARI